MSQLQLQRAAQRDVEVRDAAGLHARPAADFAAAAARFQSDIQVVKDGRTVDGKSLLLLLTLDVRHGDQVTIRAEGADAGDAVEVLARVVQKEPA